MSVQTDFDELEEIDYLEEADDIAAVDDALAEPGGAIAWADALILLGWD